MTYDVVVDGVVKYSTELIVWAESYAEHWIKEGCKVEIITRTWLGEKVDILQN